MQWDIIEHDGLKIFTPQYSTFRNSNPKFGAHRPWDVMDGTRDFLCEIGAGLAEEMPFSQQEVLFDDEPPDIFPAVFYS